jgi:RNA polymerase sigma-70 factor (ECF subfamily)
MDSHSLIEKIKYEDGELVLKEIYESYRSEFLLWAVKKYAFTVEEAKDLFQLTIIVFYENIINDKLSSFTSQVKTYLFSIGKNKINEYLRSKERKVIARQLEYSIDTDLFYTKGDENYEEELSKVEASLEELGEPCKSILIQVYYQNKTMQEVADSLGYKNTDTVKTIKYKCLRRLKKIYNSDLEDLNDI